MIADRDKNTFFFRGIKPVTLCSKIEHILKRDGMWTDLSAPPEMSEVFAAAQKHLKKDHFSIDESDGEGYSSNEAPGTNSDESSSEDEEDTHASHRHVAKKETCKKDKVSESKQSESAKEKPDNAMEDLTQCLEHLTILTQAIPKQQLDTKSAQSYMQQACPCFMCGQNEAHGMKDCPETIASMASGNITINTEGRVVCTDGKPLPRGIAKIIISVILRHNTFFCPPIGPNLQLQSLKLQIMLLKFEIMHLTHQVVCELQITYLKFQVMHLNLR